MPKAQQICENKLAAILSVNNVCDCLLAAHQCSASGLKSRCLSFASQHCDSISSTSSFDKLDAELLKELWNVGRPKRPHSTGPGDVAATIDSGRKHKKPKHN